MDPGYLSILLIVLNLSLQIAGVYALFLVIKSLKIYIKNNQ